MERLRPRDLRAVSAFLGELYAFGDLDALVQRLLTHLPRLVPSDLTVYGELNVPRQRFKFVWESAEASKLVEVFRRHAMEHPFAQKYLAGGDGSAAKLSDLLTIRQFRQLGLYEEFFRRIGIDREMIAWLPAPPPLEITVGVHRLRTDFSERDRLILNVLRPHLIQAYRNAEAVTLLQAAASSNGHATVLIASDGGAPTFDEPAHKLLAAYFDSSPCTRASLPEGLGRWIRHHERQLEDSDDVPPAPSPLIIEGPTGRLTIRLVRGPTQRLLLLHEHATGFRPERLQSLGLSTREAEVLGWVARGKCNEDIATILGISSRTVAKHLEVMYPKLGVENRTAAAGRALETLAASAASIVGAR